jgi:hypothetical protein
MLASCQMQRFWHSPIGMADISRLKNNFAYVSYLALHCRSSYAAIRAHAKQFSHALKELGVAVHRRSAAQDHPARGAAVVATSVVASGEFALAAPRKDRTPTASVHSHAVKQSSRHWSSAETVEIVRLAALVPGRLPRELVRLGVLCQGHLSITK